MGNILDWRDWSAGAVAGKTLPQAEVNWGVFRAVARLLGDSSPGAHFPKPLHVK